MTSWSIGAVNRMSRVANGYDLKPDASNARTIGDVSKTSILRCFAIKATTPIKNIAAGRLTKLKPPGSLKTSKNVVKYHRRSVPDLGGNGMNDDAQKPSIASLL